MVPVFDFILFVSLWVLESQFLVTQVFIPQILRLSGGGQGSPIRTRMPKLRITWFLGRGGTHPPCGREKDTGLPWGSTYIWEGVPPYFKQKKGKKHMKGRVVQMFHLKLRGFGVGGYPPPYGHEKDTGLP